MADTFDPYHIWLGIAPANQPPTHYRLLGIELFEKSDDVIDAAASRQALTLRDMLPDDKHAQRMLDEVLAARKCLLNAENRAKYDDELRSKLTKDGNAPKSDEAASGDAEASYHLWLGIPPSLQPPTHYRLLGIESFEESTEVIEAGAERQTRYLREVSVGPDRKKSQTLLNEVAAARRCLLDAEKRKAYDEKLRKEAEEKQKAASEQEAEKVDEPQVAQQDKPAKQSVSPKKEKSASDEVVKQKSKDSTSLPVVTDSKSKQAKSQPAEEKSKKPTLVILASVAAVVLLGAVGLVFLLSDSEAAPTDTTVVANGNADETTKAPANGNGESNNTQSSQEDDTNQEAADPSLLAHWKFEDKNSKWAANDIGPLVLAMRGDPKFVAGPVGQAVTLDGKDDALEVPVGALSAEAGSIAFWIRRDSKDGTVATPVMATPKDGPRFTIWISNKGLLNGSIGNGPQMLTTKAVLATDQWYHIALAWQKDGQARLFCNAKVVAEAKAKGPYKLPQKVALGIAASVLEGTQPAGKQSASQGRALASFDDIRCYNRALKTDELTELTTVAAVELKAPAVYKLDPIKVAVATLTNREPPTDTPPKKRKNSRNKKAKNTKPKPPAARNVQLPGFSKQVRSAVWENIGTEPINELGKAIQKKRGKQESSAERVDFTEKGPTRGWQH